MKITSQFLEKWDACSDGEEWALRQDTDDAIELVERLLEYNSEWASWLITRCLETPGQIRYAIFAAESVLDNFERIFPDDKRPQLAIEAARTALENNNEGNRMAAQKAADNVAKNPAYSSYHTVFRAYHAANKQKALHGIALLRKQELDAKIKEGNG
jgi:hypothetical protein